MKHKIKPGDYVVARLDYDSWSEWFLERYVKPRIPIKVTHVDGWDRIKIYVPAIEDEDPDTFWTSIQNKYERCGRSCPMEVKLC